MSGDPPRSVDTSFASAVRADVLALAAQRRAFLSDGVAVALLDAMPGPAMVLNRHRQIVAVNGVLREAFDIEDSEGLIGLRPGEVLQCVRANERAAGCGTTRACAHCGVVNAVLECLTTGRRTRREARVRTHGTRDGGALDVRVHASAVDVGGVPFVVVGIEDIGSEKRRQVLERQFLGELLVTCDSVHGIAERLDQPEPDPVHDCVDRRDLHLLSAQALEQVASQRQLLAAEQGELVGEPREVNLTELLEDLARRTRRLPMAQGRHIRLEHGRAHEMHTDPALLGRVVCDLLANALEATPVGGTVSLSCELDHRAATLSVHNDGVMTPEVQLQIFQRSFSTRTGAGHGVGTYGVKLLVERVLGGSVEFVSDEHVGTLFVVVVPDAREPRRAA